MKGTRHHFGSPHPRRGGTRRRPSFDVNAPHRYWRILVTAAGLNTVVIGEIEMYQSAFGPNVVTGGTASADSEFSGFYDAANAFDGDIIDTANPGWGSANTALPHWLRYDFGAGNPKSIVAIGMFARNDNVSVSTTSPTAFSVQCSDNGTDWFTKWSVSGQSWANREFKRFVCPGFEPGSYSGSPWGTHSFWRASLVGAAVVVVSELEYRATPGGGDNTSGGSATASSEFDGTFVVANAFDNNNTTQWANGNALNGGWVRYNYASPVNWAQLSVRARNDAANGFPTAIQMQFADAAGGPWTTAFSDHSESGWVQAETRLYTDPLYV